MVDQIRANRCRAIWMAATCLVAFIAPAAAETNVGQSDSVDQPPPLMLNNRTDAPASAPASVPVASQQPGRGRWSAYANETQSRVSAYLDNKRDVFGSKLNFSADLWVDAQGHVTKTQLVASSGNVAFDAAARRNFTPGLVLPPPEKDMPQPIKVRATAQ